MRPSYLILTMFIFGCATTRYTAPDVPTTTPHFSLENLKSTPLRLSIVDRRADQAGSAFIVEQMRRIFTKYLVNEGVVVLPPNAVETNSASLEIAVQEYSANFSSGLRGGGWEGCSKLMARLEATGKPTRKARGSKCVSEFNWLGYDTADSTLNQSFAQSFSELLAELDAE